MRRYISAAAPVLVTATIAVLFSRDTLVFEPLGIQTLIAVCGETQFRPIEARPFGDFAYKPAFMGPVHWRVMAAAGAADQPTVNPHLRGVAFLLVRDYSVAIEQLQRAIALSPRDPAALNDLAAAYFSRAQANHFAPDYALALNAAEQAWRIRQTSEIAWNRALALSAFHLSSVALAAWDDVARLESDPAWRAEAEQRRSTAHVPTEADAWPAIEARLHDPAVINTAVSRFPAQTYSYFDKTLLPRWHKTAAASRLGRQLAAGLAQRGERLPLETIEAIDDACVTPAACEAMGRAHSRIAAAEQLMANQSFREASLTLESIARSLKQSPYRLHVLFRRGACMLHENQYKQAAQLGRAILAAVRGRHYRTLEAHTLWLLGLATLHDARPEESIAYYAEARALFTEAHDTANTGAIDLLLADAYEYVGDRDRAMKYRLSALEAIERSGDKSQFHQALFEGGTSLATQGLDAAADTLLAQAVDEALRRNRPIIAAVASMWRSTLASRRRDFRAASEQARIATVYWRQTADPGQRALLTATDDQLNRRSAEKLTHAIGFFENAGNKAWLPQLLRQRAQVRESEGDSAGAEEDERKAIAITEEILDNAAPASIREGFTADTRGTYEDIIRLLLKRGQPREALSFAERARRIGHRETHPDVPALPAGAYAAVMEIQSNDLVVWLLSRNSMEVFRKPLPDDFHTAVVNARNHLSLLHEALLKPWIASVPREGTLYLLPPPSLELVPFAALTNPQSGRALIDDHVVAIAPHLASLANADMPMHRSDEILIVGDPDYAQAAHLRESAAEVATVASGYDHATLLTGTRATSSEVLQEMRSAKILHLATHAVANDLIPELSAIILASRNGSDTRIYVRDLLERKWPFELVVLSACSTASNGGSRGSLSIAQAFLESGSRAAVATYWPVSDHAAASFSIELHRLLNEGKTISAAARDAQLHVKSTTPRDPSWAAFCVLLGNTDRKEETE